LDSIVNGFQNIVEGFSDAVFLAIIKDNNYKLILQGLGRSLLLTVIAAVIGLLIGMLLAIAKLQDLDKLSGNGFVRGLRRWLAGFANGYISVVRGTPAVVQLMVIYFIVFSRIFQNSPFEDYQIAALAFGINSGAYVAEIIRAGILAVDRGQTEASRSLGLSSGKTMLYIVIPQAVKNVLPALGNEFIALLKETSVAGYIGIMDLTKAAQSIGSANYDYLVPLLCAAYIYFLMTTTMSTGLSAIERRMRRSD
jgi:amino ABC transporter, permease protein, 3-TM region, his/glu/gln/arg/opine family